ncbi:MarR family transcriptional regulator [Siculibacillus lacustris]|uniref:MarR family transcriptional regulator n=1 Tax=Siculibacillus lacustris TaxID=1549641 RepID=A0A4V6MZ46_9HYPH|nr:MarR family transcriptional regulator [Siculibacillus lacustris]TBW39791.1 MarR family transcriptional regulator [Siculibacillus lacustris]
MSVPAPLDDQLCFAVYGALQALTRRYRPLLAELGLTYPQYLVLLVLWRGDGLSVKALGERLDLDSGTLTPLLKRLEAAGLVARRRAAEDERVVRVDLTDRGRALAEPAAAIGGRVFGACGFDLPALIDLRDELKALKAGLDRTTA